MSPVMLCYQLLHISPLLFLICFAVPSFMHLTSEQFAIVKPTNKIIIIFFIFISLYMWPHLGPVLILVTLTDNITVFIDKNHAILIGFMEVHEII